MLPWQQSVSAAAALLAGLASFLSPCVLPLIPVYLGVLAGEAAQDAGRGRLFLSGLLFALGFSAVFIAMGATASALGRWLMRYADVLRIASGVLVIVMGLFSMGIFRFKFLMKERRTELGAGTRLGFLRPPLLGIGFAFGWTPCVGPVLTSILLLAAQAGSVGSGVGLLALYSLGLALPFLILALLGNILLPKLKKLNRYLPIIQKIGGGLLILMGILLLTGWMEKFAALGGAVL